MLMTTNNEQHIKTIKVKR